MKKVKIIALIVAVLFAVLLFKFLQSVSEPTIVEISKSEVVVAAVDIAPNIYITQDMVKMIELPDETVNPQ